MQIVLSLGEHVDPKEIGPLPTTAITVKWAPQLELLKRASVCITHAGLNTVLEALACGKPVVATAVGGIPEQIEDGRTGFLVPAGNAKALAERLTHLLSDNDLTQRMGRSAAEAARRQFDLQRQAEAYLGWYKELMEQKTAERLARMN